MLRPFAETATSGSLIAAPCRDDVIIRVANPAIAGPELTPSPTGGVRSSSSSPSSATLADAGVHPGTAARVGVDSTLSLLVAGCNVEKVTLVSIATMVSAIGEGASAGRPP